MTLEPRVLLVELVPQGYQEQLDRLELKELLALVVLKEQQATPEALEELVSRVLLGLLVSLDLEALLET